MDLSIVVPVFEESKKIGADINAAARFLESHNLKGEIIVVDDGSKDDTAEVAKKIKVSPPTVLKVCRYNNNRGKGYALRTGVKQTQGKYVMFADSGCCVPYGNTLDGLKLLENGKCDIAHGSRKMRGCNIQKAQNLYRRICSRFFHVFMIYVMKIPSEFTDTQCGFKIYTGDIARKLYEQCVTDGFMFDIEIIMRALKYGYRIKEFPVEWACDRDSRVAPTRNAFGVLSELIAIKRMLAKE